MKRRSLSRSAVRVAVTVLVGLGMWAVVGYGADPCISSDEAASIAAQYLGISDTSDVDVSVHRALPIDDETPFVNHLINRRECYVVTFDNVDITLRSPVRDPVTVPVHSLNALLDAESGKLLRVWSTEWLNPPSMERSAAEVEGNIRRHNEEHWTGFPDELPVVTLRGALHPKSDWVYGPAWEQLDAVYVVSKSLKCDNRPTWQMTVRRRVPFDMRQAPEQDEPYPIYGWRRVIDGETGANYVNCSVY